MAKTVLEKEIARLRRAETRYLRKFRDKQPGELDRLLEDKVPEKLESTLDAAFSRAFDLIFSKGSAIISKSFSNDRLVREFEEDTASLEETGRGRELRKFRRRAAVTGTAHTMLSTVTGLTLGAFGAWIPDIVIFLSVLLRNLYQISMRYGYAYDTDDEKKFMLRVIAAAVQDGDDLISADKELNRIIRAGLFTDGSSIDEIKKDASTALAHALLLMKFLQNFPVVGIVGGISDFVYMERISDYAVLKYQRRFLTDQIRSGKR